jgi:cysteine synthase A
VSGRTWPTHPLFATGTGGARRILSKHHAAPPCVLWTHTHDQRLRWLTPCADNYIKLSGRLADEIPDAVWANQFDNVNNRKAHYETTAPEIIAALPELDVFSCAAGTGGTIAGCSMFFKEHHPQVKVGLTDPKGANLHRYYRDGELKSEGNSITEGIGQGRITKNLEGFTPDYNLEIDDDAAMKACFELMTKEGLSLGLSSGINVAGAEALARQLGPG